MRRTRRIALALTILAAALVAVVGCGPSLDEEFTSQLEGQGLPVESVSVDVTLHESQVMMDLMILNSHGIDTSNIMDSELVHATVKLENGEEVTAVKYKGDVYTYKAE